MLSKRSCEPDVRTMKRSNAETHNLIQTILNQVSGWVSVTHHNSTVIMSHTNPARHVNNSNCRTLLPSTTQDMEELLTWKHSHWRVAGNLFCARYFAFLCIADFFSQGRLACTLHRVLSHFGLFSKPWPSVKHTHGTLVEHC